MLGRAVASSQNRVVVQKDNHPPIGCDRGSREDKERGEEEG